MLSYIGAVVALWVAIDILFLLWIGPSRQRFDNKFGTKRYTAG